MTALTATMSSSTSNTAVITNPPASITNTVNYSLTVGGTDITTYKYLFAAGTVDCSGTYSAETLVATAISETASVEGAHYICLLGKDSTGTWQSTATIVQWTTDFTAPTVTINQTTGQEDPTKGAISFTIIFSEAIDPTSIAATDFAQSGTATSVSWSLATSDNIVYTLVPSSIGSDGTLVPTLAASQVLDIAGNNNSASTQTDNSVLYDTTAPAAPTSILLSTPSSSPGNDSTPTIQVSGDMSDTIKIYSDSSCSTFLSMASIPATYASVTVPALGADGTYTFYAKAVDPAGNISSCSTASLSYVLDTVAPQVSSVSSSSADGTYTVAQNIEISVTFDEAVTVTSGPPTISLDSGGSASYTSGSATTNLSFNYTVGAGQSSPDLNYSSTSALSPNGATITDAAGNTANLTLPALNSASSLKAAKNIVVMMNISVTALYPTNPNWSNYIKYDNTAGGTDPFDQDDIACTGAETGEMERLNGCIHSGEKKKVIVAGYATCTNLSIIDALGVFDWICLPTGGVATFYSIGLSSGKGLRDLLDPGAWKTNYVEVRYSGVLIGSSTSLAWWSNTVQALPSNPAGSPNLALSSGTVYYLSSDADTYSYSFGGDNISVVTLNTSTLSLAAGMPTNCDSVAGASNLYQSMFCGSAARKFIWIEGSFNGNGVGVQALTMEQWKFSRIHRAKFSGFKISTDPYPVISLSSAVGNKLSDVHINGGSGAGIDLVASTRNIIEHVSINTIKGTTDSAFIRLKSTSNNNRLYEIALANHLNAEANGILIESNGNIISRVRATNIKEPANFAYGNGIKIGSISSSPTNNVITDVLTFNNRTGVLMTEGSNNITAFATAANHSNNGFYFQGGTTNYLMSSLNINNWQGFAGVNVGVTGTAYDVASVGNDMDVYLNAAGVEISNTSYFIVGTSGNCSGGTTIAADCSRNAGTIPAIRVSATSAFVGQVTTDDSVNTSDTNGSLLFDTITDWLNFLSPFRGWGRDGTYLAGGSRASCNAGALCRIYDWRLSATSVFKNVSFDGQTANGAFNGDSSACTSNALSGNVALTMAGLTFMKHAMEINDDWIGNDNGLCESNESCIYAPNIGAYQGEGDHLTGGYCTVPAGTVSNIKMYAFPTNGI